MECQLAQAADDEAVEAVFFLRQDGRGSHRLDRLSTFLQLAREQEPAGIIASTYLPHLGALIVRAHPALIRQLIARPEVEIACANRGTGAVPLETGPEAVIPAMKQLPIW